MAKKKLKDTDYLFISTYLRSREKNLLTAARMERMIDAPTADEAGKVLQEIGYGEFSATSDRELGQALAREREALFQDLYRYVPDKAVVESPLFPGLSVISAPYSGGRIRPEALRVLTGRMAGCFDFLLLDTAAGLGDAIVPLHGDELPASTKQEPGHGVGLANVRSVLVRYGGEYAISCKDRWFCFTFTVPVPAA